MQAMPGFTAVAGRRALSAGTLLVFGGGLALYQMTSLVLGPTGSREFHISLTIPAVEDEVSEPKISRVNLALGTLVAPGPAAPVSARSSGWDRAQGAAGEYRQAAPVPVPVGSLAPLAHPSSRPILPTTVPKGDEAD
jgi:hypothetical protein